MSPRRMLTRAWHSDENHDNALAESMAPPIVICDESLALVASSQPWCDVQIPFADLIRLEVERDFALRSFWTI